MVAKETDAVRHFRRFGDDIKTTPPNFLRAEAW
jgi:hypothetical protein